MEEKIIKNFEVFQKLLSKVGSRSGVISKFIESYGDRIATCPSYNLDKRSTSTPGGLVDHSLLTLKIARKLVDASQVQIDPESLTIVC